MADFETREMPRDDSQEREEAAAEAAMDVAALAADDLPDAAELTFEEKLAELNRTVMRHPLNREILYKTLACELNGARSRAGKCDGVEGLEFVDKVIGIDQQPIGRTPRSNPATYTGVFNDIRTVFSQTQDAKMRGYGPGRFSFNVKGGRCEALGLARRESPEEEPKKNGSDTRKDA